MGMAVVAPVKSQDELESVMVIVMVVVDVKVVVSVVELVAESVGTCPPSTVLEEDGRMSVALLSVQDVPKWPGPG